MVGGRLPARGNIFFAEREIARTLLAIFAVEEVAHGVAAGGVGFAVGGGGGVLGDEFSGFRGGAGRAAVGVAGLVRAELEFFFADDAGLDGAWHWSTPGVVRVAGCGTLGAFYAGWTNRGRLGKLLGRQGGEGGFGFLFEREGFGVLLAEAVDDVCGGAGDETFVAELLVGGF